MWLTKSCFHSSQKKRPESPLLTSLARNHPPSLPPSLAAWLVRNPVEDLPQVFHGECNFQMEWHVQQLHLKVTPPLCNILGQPTTEGEEILCESAHRLIHLKLLLPVWKACCKYPTGSVDGLYVSPLPSRAATSASVKVHLFPLFLMIHL